MRLHFLPVLPVLIALLAPAAVAKSYLHVSTIVALGDTATCIEVGVTGSTAVDNGATSVKNRPEHMWLLESDLDTIAAVTSLDMRLFRDSDCEDPISDWVQEIDVDDDADAVGGSASRIDVVHFPTNQNDVDGRIFVLAFFNTGGTANASFRVSAVDGE